MFLESRVFINAMELFSFVRNFSKRIGLTGAVDIPWIRGQQRCSFNLRNVFILICLTQLCASTLAYFLFKAGTIAEQADSFYTFLSGSLCLLNLLVNIWKMPQMIRTVEHLEDFIGKSAN